MVGFQRFSQLRPALCDLPRRIQVRRAATRMGAGKPFPDSDATGTEAASIALLRALILQKQTRRTVRMRNREAAAPLARSAVDSCINGRHCLYRDGAVKELDGAENRSVRRVLAYLTDTGLVTQDSIDAAVDAMGAKGPDLRLGKHRRGPQVQAPGRYRRQPLPAALRALVAFSNHTPASRP
jgi:hypothetical protein